MIASFFKKFLKTAYVSIVLDEDQCFVCLKSFKGKSSIENESKSFQLQSGMTFPVALTSYLSDIYSDNQYVFSCIMLTSINQGGIPECSKENYKKFQIDSKNIQSVCIDGQWTAFGGNFDISECEKEYEKLGGVDFVFSPLIVLKEVFANEIASQTPIMLLLKMRSFACMAIFAQNKLLYSSLMKFQAPEKSKSGGATDTTDSTFGDFFDDEAVQDLGDDNMVDLDELSVDLGDEMESAPVSDNIEDALVEESTVKSINIENAGNDLKLADFIKGAILDFYKNPLYESSFIDKLLIADGYEQNDDTKIIMENEIMIPVEIKKIDLPLALVDMAISESV
jgi:hypothetical protein